MEWYCRLVSTGRAIGPISGRDLKNLVEQGHVGPHDMVAQSAEGPWYPASHVRGLFAAPQPLSASPTGMQNAGPAVPPAPSVERSPSVASPPAHAAPVPLPVPLGVETENDPHQSTVSADIRRKKLLQKRSRRKLIRALVGGFLLANAVLLAVVLRPRGGASPQPADGPRRTMGDRASEQLKPLDTSDLDSLLPRSGTSPAERSGRHADLAATAAAFGESLRKHADQIGNVRIVIEKVEQGYPELRQGGARAWPPSPVLVVTLAISNVGETSAVNYRGWKGGPETAYFSVSPTGPPVAQLRVFPATVEVVGSVGPSRLAPGDTLRDVLVFTPPKEQAETLYCTLLGDPVGVQGKQFQFIIPTQDIVEMPIPSELAKRLGRTAMPNDRGAVSGDVGGIGPALPDGESSSPSPPKDEDKPFGNEPIPIPGVKADTVEDVDGL